MTSKEALSDLSFLAIGDENHTIKCKETIEKDLDRLEKINDVWHKNETMESVDINAIHLQEIYDFQHRIYEENEKLKKIIRDYCQIIDTNYGGVIRMYVEENEESNEKDFKLLKEVLENEKDNI